MELKKLQSQITKIFLDDLKEHNIKIDDDYLILKISEEIGEFVQSYLVYKKRCRPRKYLPPEEAKKELSKELSDVLGLVLVIASILKIDLKKAMDKKWITREWIEKR